tara:strand:+ start:238 stop:669 length:432 start_codon:yes stop_codon:yes gene_type:complete
MIKEVIRMHRFNQSCEILIRGEWTRCHNISTAKQFLRGENMKLKTQKNVRMTRYGRGYTSAEVAIMTVGNLSGLSHEDVTVMTEDCGAKEINESTFDLNGRKMTNLLNALAERHITVGEFQEELRSELDRSNAQFDSINIFED